MNLIIDCYGKQEQQSGGRIADLHLDTLDAEGKQNPFGALLLSVMGACAEIERRNIYERLCSGKAAKQTTEGKKTKAERARQSAKTAAALQRQRVLDISNLAGYSKKTTA